MKTIFLVWKNPETFLQDKQWLQMDGEEFYAFLEKTDTRGRFFIQLEDETQQSEGIVIEATREQYMDWRIEQHRREYLKKWRTILGYEVISYHSLVSEDGSFGEELLPDDALSVEQEALHHIELTLLQQAISELPDNKRWLITQLLKSIGCKSERQLSRELELSKSTVNRQINNALSSLQKFF